MLHMYVMQLGTYQTNCYMAWESGSAGCVVIDPGDDAKQIYGGLDIFHLQVEAVLLTHGHFDHAGSVKKLVTKFSCPVYMHKTDYEMQDKMLYPLAGKKLHKLEFLEDGDTLSLAGLEIGVLHTPGHTPGSVCFRIEDCLITGDTLFAGSVGRTDLPGGDWETLCLSLGKLCQMDNKLKIYPGHGEYSDLEKEKKTNPYMKINL